MNLTPGIGGGRGQAWWQQKGPDTTQAEARPLLSLGALNAVMTGSGSTVFGLFATEEEAETAAAYLKGLVPFVHVCRTV